VAFSSDRLFLIVTITGFKNLHLFFGFSNPLVIILPLAKCFANFASGKKDEIITQLLCFITNNNIKLNKY
jgi:hypothetical protein